MFILTIVIILVEHFIFFFKGAISDLITNVPFKVFQLAIGASRDLFEIRMAINESETNQAQLIKKLKKFQLKQRQQYEQENKLLLTKYEEIQKERSNLELKFKDRMKQYEHL